MISDVKSAHEFHVPVMGTGFTVDSPLKIARYGISSVISLVDDVLIEQMRKFHCEKSGEAYEEIPAGAEDSRAKRITAYLNLLHRLIERQVEELKVSPFEEGSEITRYYEMLPESPLKSRYQEMLACKDADQKSAIEKELRKAAVPGSIDVNIMTKLDRVNYRKGEKLPPEFNDAMAALRGFAQSELSSSIVFSAGLSPVLYGYVAQFDDFFPDENGNIKKGIILKVSDHRSAFIQGKFFAKRGLWISEYRIESGLNCGGHVFATKGDLLGPILEVFKTNREEMLEKLHLLYSHGLESRGLKTTQPPEISVTVQGGVGTSAEHKAMRTYYRADKVGWATPFLLVPEVSNVDDIHLERLADAGEDEIFLSDASPMGVRFWNLLASGSENARRARIKSGKPGSSCPKGFLRISTEFTEKAICKASRAYQKLKLEWLEKQSFTNEQKESIREDVLAKSCICHELAGGALLKNKIDLEIDTAICPGKTIVYFNKIVSLEEMISHIYGRIALFTRSDRPHMFIRELSIYIDHLKKEVEKFSMGLLDQKPKYFVDFKANLFEGIKYYQEKALQFVHEHRERFLDDLTVLYEKLDQIAVEVSA